jgi:hypothetical protein
MMRQVLKVKPARKNQPEILPEQQKPQKMVIDMFIKPLVGLIYHFMYFNPIKHRHRKKDPRFFFFGGDWSSGNPSQNSPR